MLCTLALIAAGVLCVPVLSAAGEPDASAASVVIVKRGYSGSAVRRVQRSLGVTPADGVFGRHTERAVRRFQRRRGLVADGVVGPLTRKAMGLRAFTTASVESGGSGGDGGADAEADPGAGASPVRLPRVLRRIAECESGGDPTAVSANGRYRGKFQFSRATWRGLGGRGDPAAAAEPEQDRLALQLYRKSGTSPWPSCARKVASSQ